MHTAPSNSQLDEAGVTLRIVKRIAENAIKKITIASEGVRNEQRAAGWFHVLSYIYIFYMCLCAMYGWVEETQRERRSIESEK